MDKELITTSKDHRIQMIKIRGSKIECFKVTQAEHTKEYVATKKIGEVLIILERDLPLPTSTELLELDETMPNHPPVKIGYPKKVRKQIIKWFIKFQKKHPNWGRIRTATFFREKLVRKYPNKEHLPSVTTILRWTQQ